MSHKRHRRNFYLQPNQSYESDDPKCFHPYLKSEVIIKKNMKNQDNFVRNDKFTRCIPSSFYLIRGCSHSELQVVWKPSNFSIGNSKGQNAQKYANSDRYHCEAATTRTTVTIQRKISAIYLANQMLS